jgi:ectoine hydroxylase-related dioxygenase (phytanoyl-CoA dioxygenase family)
MALDDVSSGDLAAAKVALDTQGYCLIKGALSEAEVQSAKTRLIEQATAEQRRGLAFRDGGYNQDVLDSRGLFKEKSFGERDGGVNQRVFMLVNKGQVFRELVVHTLIDELVGHVLGDDFLLSSMSANIVRPGCVRMGLHTDQWWMPQPSRASASHRRPSAITRHPAPEFVAPDQTLGIAPPVTVTAVWMLTEFTRLNGATEVVPGTHLSGAYPEKENQSRYATLQPEARAGTLMIFDGRLWHGNGANVGTDERIGVLATYCAPQFRQQENVMLGLDPAIWHHMPDNLKARLGYKVWNGYGRVEAEFRGFVNPSSQAHPMMAAD